MADPRVLIIDDHAVLADALAQTLLANGVAAAEAVTLTRADEAVVLGAATRTAANVALLDLYLGGHEVATPLIGPLVEQGVAVVVLTASDDTMLLGDCLRRGAVGVFPKSLAFDEVLRIVHRAATGDQVMCARRREEILAADRASGVADGVRRLPFERLTERERHVLRALVAGQTASEIAAASHVSIHTVRSHVKAVLRKLGVTSQLAAVAKAREANWDG